MIYIRWKKIKAAWKTFPLDLKVIPFIHLKLRGKKKEYAQRHLTDVCAHCPQSRKLTRDGGCSGYLYDVQILDKTPPDNTQVIVSEDVEIVINVADSTLLNEIEIDWDESLMGGGLKFRNPNATKTCSCGISFK